MKKTQDVPRLSGAMDPWCVDIHLQSASKLFDEMDSTPLPHRDLNDKVVARVVKAIEDRPKTEAWELLIRLDEVAPGGGDDPKLIDAVHAYFSRRSDRSQQDLRRLLRRGIISLAIGLSFLVTLFGLSQLVHRFLGDWPVCELIRESLLIGGWVAMWRPLEVFLYDWWPLVGERTIYDRLSAIPVRIVHAARASTSDSLGSLAGVSARSL